jgi:hypothetical protein
MNSTLWVLARSWKAGQAMDTGQLAPIGIRGWRSVEGLLCRLPGLGVGAPRPIPYRGPVVLPRSPRRRIGTSAMSSLVIWRIVIARARPDRDAVRAVDSTATVAENAPHAKLLLSIRMCTGRRTAQTSSALIAWSPAYHRISLEHFEAQHAAGFSACYRFICAWHDARPFDSRNPSPRRRCFSATA